MPATVTPRAGEVGGSPGGRSRPCSTDSQEPVYGVEDGEGGGAGGIRVNEAEPHKLPPLPDIQGRDLNEDRAVSEGLGDGGTGHVELITRAADGRLVIVGVRLRGEPEPLGIGAPTPPLSDVGGGIPV